MTDGEALMRTVCAAPRGDVPRLVYADWLEENGQPERAEFIRLQCEAQDYCRRFPSLADARTHASRLARAHGDARYAELPALDGVGWSSLWVRGFIDRAWVRDPVALRAAVDRLFTATPLVHLAVEKVGRKSIDVVLGCPHLARLETLEFAGGALSRALLDSARGALPGVKVVHNPNASYHPPDSRGR